MRRAQSVGHLVAEPLDDPHGADQVDGIGLAGAMHHEGVQRLAAGVALGVNDRLALAAGRHVVGLQHLVVAVLLPGVLDHHRAHVGEVALEARGAAGDPARALDHLLAQVAQQPAVVLVGEAVALQALEDRHPAELALEVEPDAHQALQAGLALGGGDLVAHGVASLTTVRCM